LQPNRLLAGFKGVRKAYLEKLIMNWVFLIPIVAIVMSLGLGGLAMWTDHKRKSQLLEQLHRERMAAIEKGVEPPPMTLDANASLPTAASKDVANPARVLRMGVLMLSIGIVLFFALITVGAKEASVFGLIPATLGLANLAYAAVLFRNERKAEEKARALQLPPL
jgi:hypothetical protein